MSTDTKRGEHTLKANLCFFFFFLNDPAPTETSPLPLPDALPICPPLGSTPRRFGHGAPARRPGRDAHSRRRPVRSEAAPARPRPAGTTSGGSVRAAEGGVAARELTASEGVV